MQRDVVPLAGMPLLVILFVSIFTVFLLLLLSLQYFCLSCHVLNSFRLFFVVAGPSQCSILLETEPSLKSSIHLTAEVSRLNDEALPSEGYWHKFAAVRSKLLAMRPPPRSHAVFVPVNCIEFLFFFWFFVLVA